MAVALPDSVTCDVEATFSVEGATVLSFGLLPSDVRSGLVPTVTSADVVASVEALASLVANSVVEPSTELILGVVLSEVSPAVTRDVDSADVMATEVVSSSVVVTTLVDTVNVLGPSLRL